MSRQMKRSYKELSRLETFEERYNYLKMSSLVGDTTFGFDRYLNQSFYQSSSWKKVRNQVIMRDSGLDLGAEGYEIQGTIYIHHINPISMEDIENNASCLCDPENLICTSFNTHQAIHFGDSNLLPKLPEERKPNDTCPWR